MLWPFSRYAQPRSPSGRTIEAIYGMIVAQAREPGFYRDLGVPDTVDGRFDMVVLHLWMVLRGLRGNGDAAGVSQGLIDRFCSDMDHNLRELGIGDLTVPKRMLQFSEAFYGRAKAYDAALAADADSSDPSALVLALNRNIYNGQGHASAGRMSSYVRAATAALANADAHTLASQGCGFPVPAAKKRNPSA